MIYAFIADANFEVCAAWAFELNKRITCLTYALSHYKYTSFEYVNVEHNPVSVICGLNNSSAQ